jgi:hypothetical protein
MEFAIQAFDLNTTTTQTELIFVEDSALEYVGGGTLINTL